MARDRQFQQQAALAPGQRRRGEGVLDARAQTVEVKGVPIAQRMAAPLRQAALARRRDDRFGPAQQRPQGRVDGVVFVRKDRGIAVGRMPSGLRLAVQPASITGTPGSLAAVVAAGVDAGQAEQVAGQVHQLVVAQIGRADAFGQQTVEDVL